MSTDPRAFVSETFQGQYWVSTFRHPNALRSVVSRLSPDEFELCIKLAVDAFDTMTRSVQTLQYKEALTTEILKRTEEFSAEREQLQERCASLSRTNQTEKETLKATYEKQIAQLRIDLELAQRKSDTLQDQFRELKASSEAFLKDSVGILLREKEDQHSKELATISSLHEATVNRLEATARERVEQCDRQHREAMDRMKQLYQEQEKSLRRDMIASEKGKTGEKEFDQLVLELTSWGQLINTSKLSHSTDRFCKIRGCDTRFEIKNYDTIVPSSQVTKFIRDMEENADSPLGVFVSLKTPITGKNQSFITTQWTTKHQLMVFINAFYTHSASDVLNFIDCCVDIAQLVYKSVKEKPESDMAAILQGKLEQAKIYVEKELKRMIEFARQLALDKKTQIAMIERQHTTYTYELKQNKQALESILSILLGTEEEMEEAGGEEALPVAPESDNATPVTVTLVPKPRGRPKKTV
jgi:hypothetical protein